ncbi:hypothetical protein GCM10009557_77850 [Virgisporangium ochraceum]
MRLCRHRRLRACRRLHLTLRPGLWLGLWVGLWLWLDLCRRLGLGRHLSLGR